jgi:hypothetical protein
MTGHGDDVVPEGWIDSSGGVRLTALMHRGEDAAAYVADILRHASAAELLSVRPSSGAAEEAGMSVVMLRVAPAAVREVIDALARVEAVAAVEVTGEIRDNLNDAVWQTQTNLWVNPDENPICSDGSAWCYDSTAKLFAHGVTGRGEVIAFNDSGLENDDCHFRYGPDIVHTTQAAPASIQPPNPLGPSHPSLRPGNKVVAYYLLEDPTTAPPCTAVPYDESTRNHHGTRVMGCATGDEYYVVAARAGLPLDDPTDDEEEGIAAQHYAIKIDHHQGYDGSLPRRADGTAPGAQVIVQDRPGCLVDVPVGATLRQAYFTTPGARAHNNSWSTGNTPGSMDPPGEYVIDASEADREMWRLRDLLVVFSAGNTLPPIYGTQGQLSPQGSSKSALTVGATLNAVGFVEYGMSSGSAHGPARGFRVKPDVGAPGDAVLMPAPADYTPETGVGDGDNGCADAQAGTGGTSFAAPIVAGLAANVRQYFVDGYYPGGAAGSSQGFNPTNALVKAVIVNATRNLPGPFTADNAPGPPPAYPPAPRPTFGQGWGFPVLDDTLFFAGDPTNMATTFPFVLTGVERSSLLVLNDVPNGLVDPWSINDARPELLGAFTGAITQDTIHEFQICAESPTIEDLHVTLAWSDVDAPVMVDNPLRNDLDLEVIGPQTPPVVWRPNPGAGSEDPARLWQAAFSTPGWQTCPTGCGTTCPAGQLERDRPQGTPPFCDFAGRDSRNTVENVFISRADPQFTPGTYTIRVIGYRFLGNGRTGVDAHPNFVDTDGSLDHDRIDDTNQGYALIVSGNVAASRGAVHFDRATYDCGDMARVVVRDCDGTGQTVTVTTSAGDCDVIWLEPDAPMIRMTPPFPVVDVDGGPPPSTCEGGAGDQVVVAGDDGEIRVRYKDGGAWTATAAVRVTCRSVRQVAVSLGENGDGCDAATDNDVINRGEWVVIKLLLENAAAAAIDGLWGWVEPFDVDVQFAHTPAFVVGDIPGGVGQQVTVELPAFRVAPSQPCPSTLRFRVELRGEHGFRDRVYFEVSLPDTDCSVGGMDPALVPGEVPAADISYIDMDGDRVFVKQAVRLDKTGDVDITVTWDRPTNVGQPGWVPRYNIWRGSLLRLHEGVYDHRIPDVDLGTNPWCNLPEEDPGDLPDVFSDQTLLGETVWTGSPAANFYYLVNYEVECDGTVFVLQGHWGYASRPLATDWVTELRPAGLTLDADCTP